MSPPFHLCKGGEELVTGWKDLELPARRRYEPPYSVPVTSGVVGCHLVLKMPLLFSRMPLDVMQLLA